MLRPTAALAAAIFCLAARAEAQPKPELARASPKRAEPDYDGRAAEGASAGEVLLWVPRVTLFPIYVVTDFVIRRPIGWIVMLAERKHWVRSVINFFTFGPNDNIGIVPTALVDFGFRTSAGVYFFWDDFGQKGNDLRAHTGFAGTDWLRFTLADRAQLDEHASFTLRFEAWRRPDWAFYGLGPRTLREDRTRYRADTLDGGGSFRWESGASSFEAYSKVHFARFGAGACCGDPPLTNVAQTGRIPFPPGFASGYTAVAQGAELALDTRRPRPAPGTGLRVQAEVEHDIDVEAPETRWLRWGGAIAGYADLTGHNRVLSLTVQTRFTDPTGSGEVPFTELPSIGGDAPLRGFLAGRAIDRSLAAATLEYRYPIWAFLDGTIQVAMGNVFGPHLAGFSPDLLRGSFIGGIRTNGKRDNSFDFLVGAGTETIADGFALNEIRFVFGTTRGF